MKAHRFRSGQPEGWPSPGYSSSGNVRANHSFLRRGWCWIIRLHVVQRQRESKPLIPALCRKKHARDLMGSQNEPAKQLLRKPVLKTRPLATSHQPVVAMGWIHTTTCVRRYANISGFWRKARFAHSRRHEGREAPCSGRRAAVEWHLDEGSTLKDPYKTQILVQPHTVSPLSIHQGILKARGWWALVSL